MHTYIACRYEILKTIKMKKLSFVTASIFVMLVFVLFSCTKKSDPAPDPALKIGLVGGLGSFSDAGFNQNIYTGLQLATADFPIISEARESKTVSDISTSIDYFIAKGFNLIITAGFDAAQATVTAANANPGTDFLLVDYSVANPPSNLLCAVFDVDQSSFPCGFLAAYWAYRQKPSNPVAGYVAGPAIPAIRQFSVSYANGIKYFNTQYQKNVLSLGYNATSFTDTLQGARLADSLMNRNASVIFAFAGTTGNGALYKVKESGKWAIGVDVDQYISIPQVGPVLLTSCMKGLDVMVYDVIYDYYNLYFPGGTVIHGDLANGGVAIAPFHDYEALIPDSIKAAIVIIEGGIKNGQIKTGWPE